MDNFYSTTCWNGLFLQTPQQWEAVVKENKHILFEKELCPIMEVRWEERTSVESFYKSLSKKLGFPAQIKQLPKELKSLEERFTLYAYHKAGRLSGIFCYCSTCSRLIHVHVHDQDCLQRVYQSLLSLSCHQNVHKGLWKIQDIQFTLPLKDEKDLWQLGEHSFGAGATRIAFFHKKETLTFYRIARAQKVLEKSSLQAILTGFSPLHQSTLQQKSWGYWSETTPSLLQQILYRMRKQRPFYHGRIQHKQQHDRIVGVAIKSVQPIDFNAVDQIWKQYEIIL